MIGYIMVVLALFGIADFFGFKILSKLILVGGTYLGLFMVFKEHGWFLVVYKGMLYLAVVLALLWLIQAVVQGVCCETTSYGIDWMKVARYSLVLGGVITVYVIVLAMFGGAADCEFGPMSIMTLIGDTGYLKGLLIMFGCGLVIATLAMILQEVIIRIVYSVKVALQSK